MVIFSLTGGIASGKSTVSKVFASRGVRIVDADLVAHSLVEPGKPALGQIRSIFGERVIQPDGRLDRKKLGAMVFKDRALLKLLDAIMEPHLFRECSRQLLEFQDEKGVEAICFDAPLLIEKSLQDDFRPVVVVHCSVETQIKRMATRNGFTEDEARQRIEAQVSNEVRLQHADYRISTENTMDETRSLALDVLYQIMGNPESQSFGSETDPWCKTSSK